MSLQGVLRPPEETFLRKCKAVKTGNLIVSVCTNRAVLAFYLSFFYFVFSIPKVAFRQMNFFLYLFFSFLPRNTRCKRGYGKRESVGLCKVNGQKMFPFDIGSHKSKLDQQFLHLFMQHFLIILQTVGYTEGGSAR
jgi:hypothetical protein